MMYRHGAEVGYVCHLFYQLCAETRVVSRLIEQSLPAVAGMAGCSASIAGISQLDLVCSEAGEFFPLDCNAFNNDV